MLDYLFKSLFLGEGIHQNNCLRGWRQKVHAWLAALFEWLQKKIVEVWIFKTVNSQFKWLSLLPVFRGLSATPLPIKTVLITAQYKNWYLPKLLLFIHTDVIIFSIRVSDVMQPLIPEVGVLLDWAKKVFEKNFQNESVTWVPW